jgi:hypothetical protein
MKAPDLVIVSDWNQVVGQCFVRVCLVQDMQITRFELEAR